MRQTAQVTRILSPGKVEVRVRRQSACASAHNCGSCDSCALMTNAPEVLVKAEDDRGAKVGDLVTVESETARVLGGAALLYLAPFVLFLLGYFLGGWIGGGETVSLLLGGVGFVLGLVCAKLVDRRMSEKPIRYRVTAVLG